MRKNTEAILIDDILRMLPHRHPFVLIDRVLDVQDPGGDKRVGRRVQAVKNVTFNEWFFAGHFPNRPVMPGVLILEAMAQAGAIACRRPGDPQVEVAIARIGEVRFHAPVIPGDQLIIDAEVVKDRGHFFACKVCSRVGETLIAETEILATVRFEGKEQ